MNDIVYGIKHYVAEATAYAQGTEADIAAFGGSGKSAKEYAESISPDSLANTNLDNLTVEGKDNVIKIIGKRLVDSWESASSWYEIEERIFSDGSIKYWCEQGSVQGDVGNGTVVNYFVNFTSNPTITLTPFLSSADVSFAYRSPSLVGFTVSTFKSSPSTVSWTSRGYCGKPEGI